MKLYSFYIICLVFILFACKSDESTSNNIITEVKQEVIQQQDEHEKLSNSISRAYNVKKFESESNVKFKIKFIVKDTLFYEGYITNATDGSHVKFESNGDENILTPNNLVSEKDKILFLLSEIYTMGLNLNSGTFIKQPPTEEFIVSTFKSNSSLNNYTLYSHPMTNVIQKIDFKTDIEKEVFKNASLSYEKFITVKRIPVSLRWEIKVENKLVANAEISRISYPKAF